MSARHFISDATHLVDSALRACALTNPSVAVDSENKIVYQRRSDPQHVSLVSGGGSGHEPSFAAFVGRGLLTAAVAGTVFASPSAQQVRRAIMQRISAHAGDDDEKGGTLVTVMNYTGDVLNFGLGVEAARAAGRRIEMVVVGDDAGVGRKAGGKVGRRGIAGTCLVHKISGALAETGATLAEVVDVARLVADNTVSIGASLSRVHVPGREEGDAEDEAGRLSSGEVEIGMGIHNESGSERAKHELPALVKKMLAHLLDQSDRDRAFLQVNAKDEVVLLINNLGGCSVLELGGITAEVHSQLSRDYSLTPARVISGMFMTSLNGLGFSISILRIRDTELGVGKSMLELLDSPAEATGWSAAVRTETWAKKTEAEETQVSDENDQQTYRSNLRFDYALAKKALTSAVERVIKAEPDITQYDTVVGDGDCGTGLKRGAESIVRMLEQSEPTVDAVTFMQRVTSSVEATMDGTSGALYAIFLNALSAALLDQSGPRETSVNVKTWSTALTAALSSLGKYTPAKPGDRTLMDALCPFVQTLDDTEDARSAAAAAQRGANSTKGMKANLGRTVYVGGDGWKEVPDPGAYGLAELLAGLSEGLP